MRLNATPTPAVTPDAAGAFDGSDADWTATIDTVDTIDALHLLLSHIERSAVRRGGDATRARFLRLLLAITDERAEGSFDGWLDATCTRPDERPRRAALLAAWLAAIGALSAAANGN